MGTWKGSLILERAALETAFGLSAGTPPDRLLVGLAVLSLLSEACREAPLLCTVDDAHWLDHASAQSLALAARRLDQDATVVLFASRWPQGTDSMAGLPEVPLDGLSQADAMELLRSEIPGRLDQEVARRVVAEAHGNPLALLEFGRMARSISGASGFAISTNTLPSRIEEGVRLQVQTLATPTQQFLLLAAADPVGDRRVLARAAAAVGLTEQRRRGGGGRGPPRSGRGRAFPPSPGALSRVPVGVAFSPPPSTRRAGRGDGPGHRSRPAGLAPGGGGQWPRRFRRRGTGAVGWAELGTVEAWPLPPRSSPGRPVWPPNPLGKRTAPWPRPRPRPLPGRGKRQQACWRISAPLEGLQAARAELVMAQVSQAQRDGVGAPALFLSAAGRLRDLDPQRARTAYLDALAEAIRSQVRDELVLVANSVSPVEPSGAAPPTDMVMAGWVRLTLNGYPDGIDLLTEAVHAFLAREDSDEDDLRGLWFACRAAYSGWDYESYYALSSRYLEFARRTGALSALPRALQTMANALDLWRRPGRGRAAIEEARGISQAIGSAFGPGS